MIGTILAIAVSAPAPPGSPASPVVAVMAEVDRLAAPALWPGFDPRNAPVAIFDGRQTWLFHHPRPPATFSAASGMPGVSTAAGRLPAIVADGVTAVAGVPTATVVLDTGAGTTPLERAALVIRAVFLLFVRERHPGWLANQNDLAAYPVKDVGALSLRLLETVALRRALAARSEEEGASWASAALALRRARFERVGAVAAAYERATERSEGLAEYVRCDVDGTPITDALPTHDLPAEQVRAHCACSGRAIALLLDRFLPQWQAALESGDPRALDELLADALARAGAVPADLDEDEREAAWLDAVRDVARPAPAHR